jgi:hypothetical protein
MAEHVRRSFRRLKYNPRKEMRHQFSFVRTPEPHRADSSAGGLEDGGGVPIAAAIFKLFIKSRAGAEHADEVTSVLGMAERFSAVCVRCTSGRRCTTSVATTDVGGGGKGVLGGGSGLRSARRGLRSAIVQSAQHHVQTTEVTKAEYLLTVSSYHSNSRFENVHHPSCSTPIRRPHHRHAECRSGRRLCFHCGRGRRGPLMNCAEARCQHSAGDS